MQHTGPDTLAGQFMRRSWHPVQLAEELVPGKAKPIRIMSEDFTLYRGESGTPHVVAFRCAHRGTQLSVGWVEGDDIRCFYHGWKYDSTGQCVEQPAEPEPFCQKIKIRSYPAQEYLGLVFAYLGDGAPPPLPRYPELEEEGTNLARTQYWRCNFFNCLDNDPAHGPFVHRNHKLPRGVFQIPEFSAEETEWGVARTSRWADGEYRTRHRGVPNIGSNVVNPHGDAESGWLERISWHVPVDDEHCWEFETYLVHLTGEAAERYVERRAARYAKMTVPGDELAEEILAGRREIDEVNQLRGGDEWTAIANTQDYVSQIGQGRIADHSTEHLGSTDQPVIHFRKLWSQELRALAEGRALRPWTRPPELRSHGTSKASSHEYHDAPAKPKGAARS